MKIKIELTSEEYDLLESYLDDRIRNDFTEARFGAIIEAMERGFAEWQKKEWRTAPDAQCFLMKRKKSQTNYGN